MSQDTYSTDAVLNHYFGLSLTSRFIQQYEGHTSSSKVTPTTFEFSGDDDVWIFIDNVLVADLGGIHDAASVSIDFSTGKIVINEGTSYEQDTTLYKMFEAAGQEGTVTWNSDNTTFADNTYHTLKFYYLERGNSASNMSLKYNLTEIPETGIYKVNQYGEAIEGAEFTVYKASRDDDGNYSYLYDNGTTELAASVTAKLDAGTYILDANNNICDSNENILISSRYIGTTDANGEMVFLDEYDMTYTLKELEDMFGSCFILKETEVPEGYRIVAEDIYLRIVAHQVLVCDNTYDSGVYASPNLLVTATDTLYDENGNEIDYYDVTNSKVNGTLFAVVLKYIGGGDASTDTDTSHWAPVYGSDETGYTVLDMSSYTSFYTAAIYAAQQMEENGYSDSVFSLSGSGSMQLSLTALPGDISTYYYLADPKSDTKYTVGYYYTTASSLADATYENTVRVNADSGTIATTSGAQVSYSGFSRTFGATINVPNLSNAVLVQKLDQYGNLVNGARFAMYAVEEDTSTGKIYYIADDGTSIYLDADDDGDNAGIATLADGTTTGTYAISSAEDSSEGVISVTIGNDTYTITPVEVETTTEEGSQTSSATGRSYNTAEDGTAVFDNLTGTTYYIREIDAPEGYLLNTTEIMVLVTDDTIYANAGTADDGVTVARAAGYVVATLDQMAAVGDIDNTLSWIYTTMHVNTDQSNTFAFDTYAEDTSKWSVLTDAAGTDRHAYLEYDEDGKDTLFNYNVNTARADATGYTGTRRLYTDVGWSYLEIYQDTVYHYQRLAANASTSYAYTELTDPITSLFSRSVYIQVTDPEPEITFVKIDGTTVTDAADDGEISASSSADTISGVTFAIYKTKETTDNSGDTVYEKGDAVTVTVEDEDVGNGSTKEIAYTADGDENGVVTFSGVLEAGTYWIEEVSAAAGYNSAIWHWIVTIDASGNATYEAVVNSDNADSIISAMKYYSEVTNQTAPDEDTDGNLLYTYTVDGVTYPYSYYTAEEKVDTDNNIYTEYTYYTTYWPNYYYEMPSTGGPGTRMLTLIGIALCGGAGWLFGRRRRRFQ
ncbi:MAG: fibro-slime domain-containing protein [Clostridiales bacterium]|nr:fibro-slime domain-containing protein [Clostridiales bacterium]